MYSCSCKIATITRES
uniref:Uncharacterized protein n=1 Tax=Arundo donax TaxID=35708 RepID=A0A0A9E9I2_ARUDO